MWKQILEYSLNWRADTNTGTIALRLNDGTTASINPDTVEELAALGDILRNEEPVYYNTRFGDISTGWEPTGEGEHEQRTDAQ